MAVGCAKVHSGSVVRTSAAALGVVGVGVDSHLRPRRKLLSVPNQAGEELAIGLEDVDAALTPAVVAPVADVHVPLGVNGNVGRVVDLAALVAVATELRHELAVLGQLLDAVVARVGDVDVAVLVNGYAPGRIEFAFARALGAEGADESPVGAELAEPDGCGRR